jgi:hypothetical protein
MVRNALSAAISHPTSIRAIGMPPPSSGSGARRVQRTTLSGQGSPDATPSVNGYRVKPGCASVRTDPAGSITAAAPSFQATFNSSRRDMALSARS